MRHSTRFVYVLALFLLLPTNCTKAQPPQADESSGEAARELANSHSKTISILAERLFASFLPPQREPDKTGRLMHALTERFREIYVDVATPIFARRLTVEDMQSLTGEFKTPVFQAFTAALAESIAIMMSCMRSELEALPKPQEVPSEERHRLAQQLWMLQQEAISPPPAKDSQPVNPPMREKLQEELARFEGEWRKRSDCISDGATTILAARLTADDLKALIALEQSPPVQKLNSVMEEMHEQLGLKLAEEFQKMFGLR